MIEKTMTISFTIYYILIFRNTNIEQVEIILTKYET